MALKNDPNLVHFRVFTDEYFTDLNFYQYGWERCTPLKSFGPYIRNYFLFHFILSGKGILHTNDRDYPVTAGQGFLICPGQVTIYQANLEDPWEYVWMEFDGTRVRECLSLAGLREKNPVWTAACPEASDRLRREILRMSECDLNTVSAQRAIGHCWFFLDQLVRSSAPPKSSHINNKRLRYFYIREALFFIGQNYYRDISVEEIAAFCKLHRNYLGKIFKDIIGQSPQQFLMHYRMARAEQLLKETRLPIREISAKAGYANPLHFSRAFKSVYQIAPREYRQQHFLEPAL